MSARFVELVQKMHREVLAKLPPLSPSEQTDLEVGRVCATQFIDAVRAGEAKHDFLVAAIWLIGKSPPTQMRGFLAELQEFIQETAR